MFQGFGLTHLFHPEIPRFGYQIKMDSADWRKTQVDLRKPGSPPPGHLVYTLASALRRGLLVFSDLEHVTSIAPRACIMVCMSAAELATSG